MAIVNETSDLYRDHYAEEDPVPSIKARARTFHTTGTVTNASTDSSTSKYRMCSLPSDCILLSGTFFDVENWGFAQVVIGTETDTDALVDQTKATETHVNPIADGDANHGKRLWEVLGLAADPGGEIDLWVHAEANATGAGSLPFQIGWLYH